MAQSRPAELRKQLEQHKAELVERVNKIKADISKGLDADFAEQATQLENQEVLDALANEGTAELSQINAALQRLDDGTYGVCTECGQAIAQGRLEARAYVSECITCASKAE